MSPQRYYFLLNHTRKTAILIFITTMYDYIHYLFPLKKRFFLKKTTFFIASDKF